MEACGYPSGTGGPPSYSRNPDLPHRRQVQVGIVARFAEVQLDGNDLASSPTVPSGHALSTKPHGVAEPLDLGDR